jgi:PHD/YefM family antitoxin component YafN of YafNO toxin-antitoxin module
MTGLDALQSVQFVSKKGKRLAVLSAEDWEALIEWLETLEDAQIARAAFAELKAAKGSRRRAGWLEWSAVKDELR